MKIFQVDAFTDTPFKGNPAAVCLMEGEKSEAWMQSVAMEMNLSETAFVQREDHGFRLRWFTPVTEVSLCGHATLAAAHVLWEEGLDTREEAVFHTTSGVLTARKADLWIELDFPSRRVVRAEKNPRLNEALGASPLYTGRFETPNGLMFLLEIEGEDAVSNLKPDFGALVLAGARAVIVTSRSSRPEYDFCSRFFAPGVGINEDPVTGSAHCYLTPYWADKLGKQDLVGFQSSRRSGVVGCSLHGERVRLRGKALTIFRGELVV
jgi:PhzF family phenazine biosynthesis protein